VAYEVTHGGVPAELLGDVRGSLHPIGSVLLPHVLMMMTTAPSGDCLVRSRQGNPKARNYELECRRRRRASLDVRKLFDFVLDPKPIFQQPQLYKLALNTGVDLIALRSKRQVFGSS